MPAPPPAAPKAIARDTRRIASIVLVISLVIGVPVGIVGSMNWLDLPGWWSSGGRPTPKWLTAGEISATTDDGTLVKVRVAFDVRDTATRSAVERQLRQIQLLLELSVNTQSTEDLAGGQGIERLSGEMLRRVNEYLATQGVRPVKSIAIQNLWYKRP